MPKTNSDHQRPLLGTISIVCGGSKGIGKATSQKLVQLGGSVCIIARDVAALEQAAQEAGALKSDEHQFVETFACDTTDFEKLKPLLEGFIEAHGVPDYLFNLVGYAYPHYVHELTLDDFKANMDVNYYGQLVPILVLLPHFMREKKGHIANASSMMGYFGIVGYATYAPGKFAIVGLTEVLRHELKPYDIHFSILYPPDTDTPGFEIENRTKPKETAMLSESAKLMSAEQVAEAFVDGVLKDKFNILPGEAGFTHFMFRHFPWLVRFIIDRDYQKARKTLGKE
jgi:3-dehydrosphinganine reductase